MAEIVPEMEIIVANNLTLGYERDQNVIENASFSIKSHDFVVITGESGSGKSTLLKSFYGGIDIREGDLNVCLCDLNGISSRQLRILRQRIGIIFQNYKLINEWTVERNIMLPLIIMGLDPKICREQALKLLKHVELLGKADKYPLELSGGEQQRVAMARALAHNPQLIICDEPTGNLDERSSSIIWKLLASANEAWKACVVIVTHKKPSDLRMKFRHFIIENNTVRENI